MSTTRAKPNPVVCGRRVCNGPCGRWRPITDFGHRAERSAPNGVYVTGKCVACARSYGRDWYKRNAEQHKQNVKVWKSNNPELVAQYREVQLARRRTPEGRRKEREYRKFRQDHPIMGPRVREYFRVYRNMKRHELGEGYEEKVKGSRSEHSYNFLERDVVDAEPFRQWLKKYYAGGAIQKLAEAMSIDEGFLRRILKGSYTGKNGKDYEIKHVTVGFVDRALFAAKRETTLRDLYPHLYR